MTAHYFLQGLNVKTKQNKTTLNHFLFGFRPLRVPMLKRHSDGSADPDEFIVLSFMFMVSEMKR
jgi:hypothetical protein